MNIAEAAIQGSQVMVALLLVAAMSCGERARPVRDAGVEPVPRCTSTSDAPSAVSCRQAPGLEVARLRANFCANGVASDSRALSVQSEQVVSVFQVGDASPLEPRFKVSAAPVLIGLDFDTDCRQLEPVHVDRTEHRVPDGPPGDGFDMYGVRTSIKCSAGSCDASAGQLCSDEAPGWNAEGDSHHCIAYPMVHEAIDLLGYNFWDPCSAVLMLTELEEKSRHKLTLASRIGVGEPSNNDTLACTPSPDGVHLSSAGVQASVLARFTLRGVSVPRGRFYRLQMFNKNGTLRTQHDVEAQLFRGSKPEQALPRALHVCWRCDPASSDQCPADCATASDTYCAAARCTQAISQTCESDGCADSPLRECAPDSGRRDGTCDSGLWSGTPRSLTDSMCQHEPGDPAPCAETPMWIGSEPEPTRGFPLIYVD